MEQLLIKGIPFAQIVVTKLINGDVMDDELVRYVNKSSYRVRVLKSLGENAKMPKEIAKDSEILPNHISNVLRQLKEKEIVECINPEVRKGRLYRLTDKGDDVVKNLK